MHKLIVYWRYFLMIYICISFVSCASFSDLDKRNYARVTVKAKILSAVKCEIDSFTSGPMMVASVSVEIIAPEYLRRQSAQLIIRHCAMKDYDGPKTDGIWREIGSIQELNVLVNTRTSEYSLYQSVGSGGLN